MLNRKPALYPVQAIRSLGDRGANHRTLVGQGQQYKTNTTPAGTVGTKYNINIYMKGNLTTRNIKHVKICTVNARVCCWHASP